jgi:predicted Zn-dependent protease
MFTAPMKSMADVGTNVWIAYAGKQRADGVVVAEKAAFAPNGIKDAEDKLRNKAEYDPASVDPTKPQGVVSKLWRGIDAKRLPPYQDAAMQARVDRIGMSLVPEYQRALPDTDATKIQFRFQVIDAKRFRDALTLPNGIILVPKQVIERMENDAQLATVLADNIACALEKQEYQERPAREKMSAAQWAGLAGGLFVPGLGVATSAMNAGVEAAIERRLEEQSGRVSLGLMRDAGYDVYEAPRAWWVLAEKKGKDLAETKVPFRGAYLYGVLGSTWREGKGE